MFATLADSFARHRRLVFAIEVAGFALFAGIAIWAIGGEFHRAWRSLERADAGQFAIGCGFVAAYYLIFVLGWIRILRAWGIRITYPTSLRAEMVSMLAKYIPGGIWTPAARIVALRRAGVTDTALVTASLFVEAGLSAVAGVLVFVVSLRWVHGVNAPLTALITFALLLVVLLHPRIFHRLASRIVRRFGRSELPALPWRVLIELLGFYCFTWLIGGAGLLFILRSLGDRPGLSTLPYLGGVSAVGAIVAVLAFFAPSGLGPREATMYALLLAITTPATALAATVLNRLAITIVEVLLLLAAGVVPWIARRLRPP